MAAGGVRGRIGRWLSDGWTRRGVVYWAFLDASVVVGWVARRRRRAVLEGRKQSASIGKPVVVVGSLFAGGTGKTPIVVALIEALRARGRRPGVVARGYGVRIGTPPIVVTSESDPAHCGDEPVLIARRTGAPVVVHPNRVAAARALCAAHPEIDIVLCDDGLQHYALARDFEIIVYDARGAGNGRPLPAGPLREPVERPRDATLFMNCRIDARLAHDSPAFSITPVAGPAYRLADRSSTRPNEAWAGMAISAFAGLGDPRKFFAALRSMGAEVDAHPLPDHHVYTEADFAMARHDTIVITEKDAVKCERLPKLHNDPRIWVLPIRVQLPDVLTDRILEKLHGSQAA